MGTPAQGSLRKGKLPAELAGVFPSSSQLFPASAIPATHTTSIDPVSQDAITTDEVRRF